MSGDHNITCSICGHTFRSLDELQNHNRARHQPDMRANDPRAEATARAALDEVNEGGPVSPPPRVHNKD